MLLPEYLVRMESRWRGRSEWGGLDFLEFAVLFGKDIEQVFDLIESAYRRPKQSIPIMTPIGIVSILCRRAARQ